MTSRRLLAVVSLVSLPACGGSNLTGGSTPPPPPPAVPVHSTAGTVYTRADGIAYGPEATPSQGLMGAAISFGSASATSGSQGTYSITTSATLNGDFLNVTAAAAGYQPAWAPFLTYEPARPVHLALYPEVPVTVRPGFLKGIDFMDSGGGLRTIYDNGRHAMVMERVRDQDGVNLVMTTEHFGVSRFRVATNEVGLLPDPFGVYSRAVYQNLVSQAKSRGLQFMMNLAMAAYTTNVPQPLDAASHAEWNARFQISRTNEPFWDAFFAAWTPLVLERASIARDLGIEFFGLGFNLDFVTRTDVSRWQKLIADIRALGYAGKITYFWNPQVHTGFPEWSSADPALLRLFDLNGARMSTVVARSSSSEVLAREQTRARMRASVTAALDKLAGFPPAVILLVTVPSVHGGIVDPEFIEPCILAGCNSTAPQRTRDFQQQADAYQAIAEAVNATPTGNGRVMGLITAQYWFYENFTSGGNGAYDKGTNVRGKPAEMVLKWWFNRW